MSSPAISFDAPLKQPTTVAVPAGVTFDAPVSSATSVSLPSQAQSVPGTQQTSQSQQPQPAQPTATISATTQPHGVAANVEQWADDVKNDLLNGTANTKVGALLKYLGAPGLASGVSPGAAEFMGSPLLGPTRMVKGAAEIPQSGKHWQGMKDVAGGALQAATIPGSFAAPEAGDAAASAADRATGAIAEQAGRAAKAIKGKYSLSSVQPELQQSIRNVLDKVAADAGINQPIDGATLRRMFNGQSEPPSSIRDVAANLATALKSKASALYKQLDAATGGGRFQRFDEQLQNIHRAIREVTGIDPDREGALVERLNDVEAAKQKALAEAKAAGVDPKLIDKANATWKQASALEDFSHHLRASTAGMRPELAAGEKTNAETLSTAKLFPRINALWNSGRLQQALGEDKATDLLQAVDAAHLRTLKIKAAQHFAKTAAKYGAYAAGLGYAGHEALRHWIGE